MNHLPIYKWSFTAPISGHYLIESDIQKSVPTGEYEIINRKWFEFWKPKTTKKAIYKTVILKKETKIECLKKGDVIKFNNLGIRKVDT